MSSKPVALADTGTWQPELLDSLRHCGVQREPVSAWRRLLLLLALVGIGSLADLVPTGISFFVNDPDEASFFKVAFWVLLIPPLLLWGTRARKQYYQMKSRSAVKVLESPKAKRPIFYLRSFQLDGRIAKPTLIERFLSLPNAEQKVTAQLRKLGPVVAIGRPGEKLPALGAARFYVTDELWHEKVADVVKASQLVLWATGLTDGLRWEISHLIESLPPEKLVLWAHPHLMHLDAAEREAEWTKFLVALGQIFPKRLPETLGDARFFCFAADWTPIAIAPPWRGPMQALRSFFNPLGSAMRAVRRIEQGKIDPQRIAYRDAKRDSMESDFRTLIGAGVTGIRWTNMLTFAVALAATTVTSLWLLPLVFAVLSSPEYFLHSSQLSELFSDVTGGFLVRRLAGPLLFSITEAACVVIAFHKVRNERWAAMVAAAACTLLLPLCLLIDPYTRVEIMGPESSGFASSFLHLLWGLRYFMFVSAKLMGLVYAVKKFRPLARALWLGEAGGSAVGWLAAYIVAGLSNLIVRVLGQFFSGVEYWSVDARISGLDYDFKSLLISSLVFALVILAGTRMIGSFDRRTPKSTLVAPSNARA